MAFSRYYVISGTVEAIILVEFGAKLVKLIQPS